MSSKFTSSDDFISVIGINAAPDFIDCTPFTEGIGFSVQRPYPATCRYKPPVKKDGHPDTFALIGVVYASGRNDPKKPALVPVSAKVSVYSRYIAKHMDYNFDDDACPTEESILTSKRTPRPIDLSAVDQYFYDHERECFRDSKGEQIAGIEIIRGLYEQHLATVDKLKGLIFRWKLASIGKASLSTKPIEEILEWLLKILCGRSLEPEDVMRGIWHGYRPEDMKLLKTESIDVFGYRASKNVIGTFCTILLFLFTTCRFAGHTPAWIKVLANNTFLGFAACILSIAFLDHLLPRILFRLINMTISMRWRFMTINIRFK